METKIKQRKARQYLKEIYYYVNNENLSDHNVRQVIRKRLSGLGFLKASASSKQTSNTPFKFSGPVIQFNSPWVRMELNKFTALIPKKIYEQIVTLVKSGHPIPAIKELRSCTGCGLLEAKQMIMDHPHFKEMRVIGN